MTDIEENRHNWSGPPIVYAPREHNIETEGRPVIVDLFSGPGGISEGFKKNGFVSGIGVDIHELSIDTYRYNHPEAYSILGNIKSINGQTHNDSDIFDVIGLDSYGGESRLAKIFEKSDIDNVDVMSGGIPCQGFSLANKKQDDEDERNYLFEELIKCALILNPSVILIENVSSMRSAKDGEFVDAIVKCLREIGYNTEYNVLNSDEYGVPQSRERLFFVATKTGKSIEWPEKTHNEDSITVREAISDLAPLEPSESSMEYATQPQNNYQKMVRRKTDRYANHSAPNHRQTTVNRIEDTSQGEPMYERFKQRVRLDENSPSPTIVSGGIRPQFQLGHPTQARGLTVRERARLQSFPDSYKFCGGMTQGRVQTGMAVPPVLAYNLAKSIRELL